jgi:putative iron-dependent peroxidase
VVRRPMPSTRDEQGGLYFVAFSHLFDAFETQFRKMLGLEDDIVDALFQISMSFSNAYFVFPRSSKGT